MNGSQRGSVLDDYRLVVEVLALTWAAVGIGVVVILIALRLVFGH